MKQNRLIIIGTVFLVLIAIYILVFKQDTSTIAAEVRDFAVEDTATINKIFLVDKGNNHVLLKKIKIGEWQLNNTYTARKDAVDMLLYTIKNIEVKSPVSKKARENVIKNLASGAVKIEIYQADKLTKVYYVGGETQDQLGTYMLLANAETGKNYSMPFIMYIPGFDGYLTSRYFTIEADWREHTVFKYTPPQLKTVKLEYPKNPELGFEINILGGNTFTVTSLLTKKLWNNFDTLAVKKYLSYYQDVQFEVFENALNKAFKDSLLRSIPTHIVTVTTTNAEIIKVKTFSKAAAEGSQDIQGNSIKYDPDKMYALINNGKDVVLIQQYAFGKIFQAINYFK